jgi:hypothetical protein
MMITNATEINFTPLLSIPAPASTRILPALEMLRKAQPLHSLY